MRDRREKEFQERVKRSLKEKGFHMLELGECAIDDIIVNPLNHWEMIAIVDYKYEAEDTRREGDRRLKRSHITQPQIDWSKSGWKERFYILFQRRDEDTFFIYDDRGIKEFTGNDYIKMPEIDEIDMEHVILAENYDELIEEFVEILNRNSNIEN